MVLWIEDYVIKNKYSRPATKLQVVKGIVIHYTANKGGTAKNHADYFDGADGGAYRYAGCHFFVDKHEIRLIVPLDEVCYQANEAKCKIARLEGNANLNTIGIEMCIEKDGSLHSQTVAKTEALTKALMQMYSLTADYVYRHYDVTGKNCPAMWVKHPEQWTAFKKKLSTINKITDTATNTATKPKLLTVLVNELYTYKTANWSDKGKTVGKGEVFTVVGEVTVGGYKMYKLKSGLYITGAKNYVSVK